MLKARFLGILTILCLSNSLYAQTEDFHDLLKERDGVLSKLLTKKIEVNNAVETVERVHANFAKMGKKDLSQEASLYLGYIFHLHNKGDTAISILKNGFNSIDVKNDTLRFKYISLIAELFSRQSKYDSAENYYNLGYQFLTNKPELERQIPNEAVAFYNSFMYFLKITDGNTSFRKGVLDKAYGIAKTTSKTAYQGYLQEQFANYYAENNELELAEKFGLLALKNLRNPSDKLRVNIDLANLYITLGQWDKLEKLIEVINKNLGQTLKGSKDLNILNRKYQIVLAKWLFHEGLNEQAKSLLVNPIKNTYRSRFDSQAYYTLAKNSKKPEQTTYLDKSISEALHDRNGINLTISNVLYPKELINGLKLKILTLENATYNETRTILKLISQIQKKFPYGETKYSYQEKVRPFLSQLINNERDNPSHIFEFMEFGKAGILTQVISDQKIKINNVNSGLLQKERNLNQNLTKLRLKHAKSPADSLQYQIDELNIKKGFLLKTMEKESPAYYALKYQDNIVKTSTLQRQLNKNQAIINYFLQDNNLYSVLLKKEGSNAIHLALDSTFRNALDSLLKEIYTNPGFGNFKNKKTAHYLYQKLLGNYEKDLENIEQLIILKDGLLSYLPFEVLETSNGEPLLLKFEISYDYSANRTSQLNKFKKLSLPLAIAPYANTSIANSTFRDENLGMLPFSEDEVDQISGTVFKNQSATKNHFLQDYQKHGIIHFATHAQMDDQDPSRSFIAFYPDSSDYKLYTEELYNLSLQNTQLVVLSACEAGGGKLQQGEGLMSLARGFAYAGCPSVITTLWKANDQSTAWLSERLHHYLKKGWNKAKALQQAKIDFRKSDIGQEFDHPYYWANFILIGNDEPLELSIWELYKWWILASSLLLLILPILLTRFRKKLKP